MRSPAPEELVLHPEQEEAEPLPSLEPRASDKGESSDIAALWPSLKPLPAATPDSSPACTPLASVTLSGSLVTVPALKHQRDQPILQPTRRIGRRWKSMDLRVAGCVLGGEVALERLVCFTYGGGWVILDLIAELRDELDPASIYGPLSLHM
ncbi:UNVERIFIED_CONTAM: hypothetical protein FKN15_070390 [Acipenser sinensis]